MTYLIDYSIPLPGESKYNATIARMDVVRTFLASNAKFINWRRHIRCSIPKIRGIVWRFEDLFQALSSLRCIHKGDIVYFQYPYLGRCLSTIIKMIKSKKAKVTLLIHDLEFLRYSESSISEDQIKLFNNVDCLLVHTSQMKERLSHMGVITEMKPIILFDYYAKDPYRSTNEQLNDKKVIAFAGNLNKSIFLRELDKSDVPSGFTFNLYGVKPLKEYNNAAINYQGKFSPEHTGTIHAGWGLVWDGDGIDTCSGSLGNYLRMISPHKLSLYIASGIPVIVWSQSAHSRFVQDNNIGFAVNSIHEIYNKINNITDEQYKEMVTNTRQIGNELRRGGISRS